MCLVAFTYPWKFLCALGWLLVLSKKTRRQHFYHHYLTRQLSPDLCLLACASWMISGLSTSAERGALITGREIETKLNSFFLRGENKPSDSPASVWHTAHLHRANSTQKWKEHGKKVTLSVHLLWNLLNVQEYAVIFIQEGKKQQQNIMR